jgi:hypothetical protein
MKRNLIHHAHVPISKERSEKSTLLNGVKTKLHSIGRDGFTIVCDQQKLIELLPNPSAVSPKTAVRFTSEFTLPGFDKSMMTQCEAYYARRLSRDSFQMSLKFVALSAEQIEIIDEFVETCFSGNAIRKSSGTTALKQQDIPNNVKALNFAA